MFASSSWALRRRPHTCFEATEADIILTRLQFPCKFQTTFQLNISQSYSIIVVISVAECTFADSIDILSSISTASTVTENSFSLHQVDFSQAEDVEVVTHSTYYTWRVRPLQSTHTVMLFYVTPRSTIAFSTRNDSYFDGVI